LVTKKIPVVKFTITDINRVCNVNNNGQFSANILKFWMLWISRLSDQIDSDFYICPTDLYSKLMDDGFKFHRVRNKINFNIFHKKMIILPIALGKKIWMVCVILNPSSLVIANTTSLFEYAIQLFDSSTQSKNELHAGSNCNNICKNVTLWLKHLWCKINNLDFLIATGNQVFINAREIVPYVCKFFYLN
jgi:Ulp1 family protease